MRTLLFLASVVVIAACGAPPEGGMPPDSSPSPEPEPVECDGVTVQDRGVNWVELCGTCGPATADLQTYGRHFQPGTVTVDFHLPGLEPEPVPDSVGKAPAPAGRGIAFVSLPDGNVVASEVLGSSLGPVTLSHELTEPANVTMGVDCPSTGQKLRWYATMEGQS